MIDASTRLICLIGDPVEHSISPLIHNAAFRLMELNYIYLAFRVKKEALNEAVRGLKSLGVMGFNVTIPHKIAIMEYLDEISEEAIGIGSVNTVVNHKGRLKGYNTDAQGALNALEDSGFEVRGSVVTILGAGGAGRAVAYGMLKRGASALYIINRTLERGLELANRLRQLFSRRIEALPFNLESLREAISHSEILINCTPVGMYPNIDEIPIPPSLIRKDLIVMDVVYNPLKTRLLREAEKRGAKTVYGIGMLVHQAALAFKLWTGVEPPVDHMLRVAYSALRRGKGGRNAR